MPGRQVGELRHVRIDREKLGAIRLGMPKHSRQPGAVTRLGTDEEAFARCSELHRQGFSGGGGRDMQIHSFMVIGDEEGIAR